MNLSSCRTCLVKNRPNNSVNIKSLLNISILEVEKKKKKILIKSYPKP